MIEWNENVSSRHSINLVNYFDIEDLKKILEEKHKIDRVDIELEFKRKTSIMSRSIETTVDTAAFTMERPIFYARIFIVLRGKSTASVTRTY